MSYVHVSNYTMSLLCSFVAIIKSVKLFSALSWLKFKKIIHSQKGNYVSVHCNYSLTEINEL